MVWNVKLDSSVPTKTLSDKKQVFIVCRFRLDDCHTPVFYPVNLIYRIKVRGVFSTISRCFLSLLLWSNSVGRILMSVPAVCWRELMGTAECVWASQHRWACPNQIVFSLDQSAAEMPAWPNKDKWAAFYKEEGLWSWTGLMPNTENLRSSAYLCFLYLHFPWKCGLIKFLTCCWFSWCIALPEVLLRALKSPNGHTKWAAITEEIEVAS